jgi:hypothetical protein
VKVASSWKIGLPLAVLSTFLVKAPDIEWWRRRTSGTTMPLAVRSSPQMGQQQDREAWKDIELARKDSQPQAREW